jgi:hypothetical protein
VDEGKAKRDERSGRRCEWGGRLMCECDESVQRASEGVRERAEEE